MKKIGLYITSLLLLLVLAACGTKELDKSEVLSKSIEASTALESYSIEMDMDIDAEDMQQKMTLTGDVTNNPDAMYLNINMEVFGMEMISEMYLKENEVYMSMFEQWVKMDAEALGISSFNQLNEEGLDQLKQFEEQFEMTEEEDQYILTLSGNDEAFKVLVEDYVSSSLGGDLSAAPEMEELVNSMTINQIDLEYHVDKESFIQTKQVFNIDLEMDMEGTKIPLKMTGEAIISNINGVEPIEVPAEAIENAITEDEMYSEEDTYYEESLSIEEVQELTSYQVVVPTAIPEDYVFTEGFYDESMEMATLSFDKDVDNWVMFSINPLEYYSLADYEGEEISVRGTTGLVYEMEDYVNITWEENGLLYDLVVSSTELTKDQVLEIAESLQ